MTGLREALAAAGRDAERTVLVNAERNMVVWMQRKVEPEMTTRGDGFVRKDWKPGQSHGCKVFPHWLDTSAQSHGFLFSLGLW